MANIQKQVSEILSLERQGGLKRAMLDVLSWTLTKVIDILRNKLVIPSK